MSNLGRPPMSKLMGLPDGYLRKYNINSVSNLNSAFGASTGSSTMYVLDIFIDLSKPFHDLRANNHLRGLSEVTIEVTYSDHSHVQAKLTYSHNITGQGAWESDMPLKHFKGIKGQNKSKLVSWAARRNYHKKRLIRAYYKIVNLTQAPYEEFLTPTEITELQAIAAKLQKFIDGYRDDYRIAKNLHIV